MTYSSKLRALQELKDWTGPIKKMSADAAAEIELRKRIYGPYKKSDPTCKICFVKISKNGSCNC